MTKFAAPHLPNIFKLAIRKYLILAEVRLKRRKHAILDLLFASRLMTKRACAIKVKAWGSYRNNDGPSHASELDQ
jgi:hypothetical protein